MINFVSTPKATTGELSARWVVCRDADGRRRLEMRWSTTTSTAPAVPRPRRAH